MMTQSEIMEHLERYEESAQVRDLGALRWELQEAIRPKSREATELFEIRSKLTASSVLSAVNLKSVT